MGVACIQSGRFGVAGAPDFDLSPYSPTLWLAADDMTGFADADIVGGGSPKNWNNLGSAGGNFAQATANRRPTYQTNEVNTTLPVVRFLNTPAAEEDSLISTVDLSTILSLSAYAFFIVVRPTIGGGTDGSARYYRRPRLFGTNSNDQFHIGLYDTKFALNHNSVTGPKILTPTAFTVNTWSIVECYYDGTTMSIRFNGLAAGTIAGANVASITGVKTLIGLGTDLKFDGDTAEVVGFNTYPGAADMTAIRQGLGVKYGITV